MLKWPFDVILPIVYNDALTMQENLQILFDKTNEVIENADSVQDLVYKILNAYLTDYVTTLSYDKNSETILFDLTLTILQEPENVVVNEEGKDVSIFAYVAGATNYQWEYSTDSVNWYNSIDDGAQTYVLNTAAITARNNILYRLKCWNATRTVYSKTVSIKVDINGDNNNNNNNNNNKISVSTSWEKDSDTLGIIPNGSYVVFKADTTNADWAVLEYSDDNGENWTQGLQQQLDPNEGHFADGWPMYSRYNMRKWRVKVWNDTETVYADYELEVIQ